MARTIGKLQRNLWLVLGLAAAMLHLVQVQAAEPVARIGVLAGSGANNAATIEPLLHGLRELGWVQGRNLAVDYRFAEGRVDRLPDLAAELIQHKVDVIVAVATPASLAAKRATKTIPIVMVAAGDPVATGLVGNLAHPGGNVTGVSFDVSLESFTKSLELFGQTIQGSRSVAVLINPANPAQRLAANDLRAAARSLGMQLVVLEASRPQDFDDAFALMSKHGVAGVFIVTDPLFIANRKRLAELALQHHLPTTFGLRNYVDAGGLMSYGPNIADSFHRAATYVDKILRGAKAGELPVEQPSRFELVINLKVAGALGLSIPQTMLLRADEAIR